MRIIDCEQGSPEWHAIRRGIPTATDFADIVTAVRGDLSASAEGLIDRLIDEVVRPDSGGVSFTSRAMDNGRALEPLARRAYEFLTGYQVQQCGFLLRDDGKAGCSPDGLIRGPNADFSHGLEIKCPDGPTHVGYLRAGVLPPKYRQQVHGALAISALPRWDFFSFCPGHAPFCVAVHPDDYTVKLARALDQFVERLDHARRLLGVSA